MGVDAMATKYPGMNPYNFTMGNPIMAIDPDGNDAWPVTQQWTPKMVRAYQNFVTQESNRILAIGNLGVPTEECTFDCTDLAVVLLVRFASENGLPVSFTANRSSNESGYSFSYGDQLRSDDENLIKYDPSNPDKSIEEYTQLVRRFTGAQSIRKFDAFEIGSQELAVGDLRLSGIHTELFMDKTGDVFKIISGTIDFSNPNNGVIIDDNRVYQQFIYSSLDLFRWNEIGLGLRNDDILQLNSKPINNIIED